jgi:maleate isomerase
VGGRTRASLEQVLIDTLGATKAGRVTLRVLVDGRAGDDELMCEVLGDGATSMAGYQPSLGGVESGTRQHLRRSLSSIVQNDVLTDGPKPPQALVDRFGVRAQILAPLVRDRQLLGWVSVHHLAKPRVWTAHDIAAADDAASRVQTLLFGEPAHAGAR